MRVEPGFAYTRDQLEELVDQETANEIQARGLVLQFDVLSETFSLVDPRLASVAFSGAPKRGEAVFAPNDPIIKRTAQERKNSLMLKMIEDCKRAGTVPGLSDERISEIVGEAWKAGESQVTAEVVREVAAHFLQQAENDHNAKLAKQITRHED